MTHKCRKNPLPESRRDLFVANRSLLSIHVQVKLLCSAGQKPLQTNKEEDGCLIHGRIVGLAAMPASEVVAM